MIQIEPEKVSKLLILNLECSSCREKVEQLAQDVENGHTKFRIGIYVEGEFIHLNELEAIQD